MSDCRSERILRLAHVLALVLREHLDDDQRAFSSAHVDVDLEVLARSHRLTVKVPGDGRRGHAAEEDTQHGSVTVSDRLVPQRHSKPRRLLLLHLHWVLHRRRHPERHFYRGSGSCRYGRLLKLDCNFALL